MGVSVVVELNIDWRGLYNAFQTNNAEYRCFLCLDDGQVVKLAPTDPQLEQVRTDTERFTAIEVVPSRIQYQWVADFVETIETEETRSRMLAAINGKGAFRRFKDILLTLPEERTRWFEFRDRQLRTRVLEWVKEHGLMPSNEPNWSSEPESSELTQPITPETIAAPNANPALAELLAIWATRQHLEDTLNPEVMETLIASINDAFVIRKR